MMQRIQSTRQLLINRNLAICLPGHFLEVEELHHTMKALIKASHNFQNPDALVGPITLHF